MPRGSARGTASGIESTSAGGGGTAEPEGMLAVGSGLRRARLQPESRKAASVRASATRVTLRGIDGCISARRSRIPIARRVSFRPARRRGRRDATGDGRGEVVHRHGVAHAAVVARDHFEILEADAVRGPDLQSPRAPAAPAWLSASPGVEVDALGLEARDGFVEREIGRVGGDRRVGLQHRLGQHRAVGHPAVLLEVVSDAGDDVVPVGEQVALLVVAAVDGVARGNSTA